MREKIFTRIGLLCSVLLFLLPSALAANYYVNQTGVDTNNGSLGYPIKTIAKLNSLTLAYGDKVYFNGNDTWREPLDAYITVKHNVTFGSYGVGKAKIFGSVSGANTSCWNEYSTNIWNFTCNSLATEIGEIFLPDEDKAVNMTRTMSKLQAQDTAFWNSTTDSVYWYSVGNPATVHPGAIEIAEFEYCFDINNVKRTIIENLNISYCGHGGIGGNLNIAKDMIVRDNAVMWGGSSSNSEDAAGTGNAISFSHSSQNITVYNNYVYQVWDSCIASATSANQGTKVTYGLNFFNNTLVKCGVYAIEMYSSNTTSTFENITIDHNTIVMGGLGYSARKDYVPGGIGDNRGRQIRFSAAPATAKNINFTNNIVWNSSYLQIMFNESGLWKGEKVNMDYNLYYLQSNPGGQSTLFSTIDSTTYNTLADTTAGKGVGMNNHSLEINPLLRSDFSPMQSSPICTMSSTGSYIGALPCVGDSAAPSIAFTDNTPANGSRQLNYYVNISTFAEDTSEFYTLMDKDRTLQLWWNLNGNANDSSSYGDRDGTLLGGIPEAKDCKYYKCYNFSQGGDYILSPNMSFSYVNNFTVSMWLKSYTVQPAGYIAWYILHDNKNGTLLRSINNRLQLKLFTTTESLLGSEFGAIDTNWHNVVVTVNESNPKQFLIYYDGFLNQTQSFTGNIVADWFKIRLGSTAGSYNSSMDELVFFNRSLQATEIQALYNGTKYQYQNYYPMDNTNHTIQAYAIDIGGNLGQTEDRIFSDGCTVPYPYINLTSPTYFCAGKDYNLTTDNPYAVRIAASNIQLDCQNTLIYGNQSSYTRGIHDGVYSNVTIRNCRVAYFNIGFSLTTSLKKNVSVYDSEAINCTSMGAYMGALQNLYVSNFSSHGAIQSHGLYLDGLNGDDRNFTVVNSFIYDNKKGGIQINSANKSSIWNVTLINNMIYGNGNYGIRDAGCKNSLIFNNTLYNNTPAHIRFGTFGDLNASENTTFQENTLYDADYDYYVNNVTERLYLLNNIFPNGTVRMKIFASDNFSITINETSSVGYFINFSNNGRLNYSYNGRKQVVIDKFSVNNNNLTAPNNDIYNSSSNSNTPFSAFSISANEYYLIGSFSPTVTLLSPSNGAVVESPSTFSYEVIDANEVNCSLYMNSLLADTINNASTTGTNSVSLPFSIHDDNTWYVSCVDYYGNTGTSGTYTITHTGGVAYSPMNDMIDGIVIAVMFFVVIFAVVAAGVVLGMLQKGELTLSEASGMVIAIVMTAILIGVGIMIFSEMGAV